MGRLLLGLFLAVSMSICAAADAPLPLDQPGAAAPYADKTPPVAKGSKKSVAATGNRKKKGGQAKARQVSRTEAGKKKAAPPAKPAAKKATTGKKTKK